MKCPNCGTENPGGSNFCVRCGAMLSPAFVPYYPPFMKKSRDDRTIIIIVVVVIAVLVIIPVIMAALLYIMVLGINSPDFGNQNIIISMSKDSTATDWVLTVVSMQGSVQIQLDDVYICVKNADYSMVLSTRSLSTMTSGVYYSGAAFFDSVDTGTLNIADYFKLSRTTYSPGSNLILTNPAGTTTYASCII